MPPPKGSRHPLFNPNYQGTDLPFDPKLQVRQRGRGLYAFSYFATNIGRAAVTFALGLLNCSSQSIENIKFINFRYRLGSGEVIAKEIASGGGRVYTEGIALDVSWLLSLLPGFTQFGGSS
jgi:hypothetical protein